MRERRGGGVGGWGAGQSCPTRLRNGQSLASLGAQCTCFNGTKEQILTQTHAIMLSARHSERRNAVQGVEKVVRKGDWCAHKSANTDSFPGVHLVQKYKFSQRYGWQGPWHSASARRGSCCGELFLVRKVANTVCVYVIIGECGLHSEWSWCSELRGLAVACCSAYRDERAICISRRAMRRKSEL
jgi:hypothetical protein